MRRQSKSFMPRKMALSSFNGRSARFVILALVLITCGYILSSGSSYSAGIQPSDNGNQVAANWKDGGANQGQTQKAHGRAKKTPQDGLEDEPVELVTAPKSEKISATFVSLARNQDLIELLLSIRLVEDRFNKNYHYDWVFLNDKPFSEEFKEATSAIVSGKTKYGVIPEEHWSYPEWIDQEKAALVREEMKRKRVIYGDSVSYRHMCRFESGFFWRHELMEPYEYYWRVEPSIQIYCDVDYDIFKWMKDNKKKYSFTIALPEFEATIPTLWDTSKKFMDANPQFIHPNNMLELISNDEGNTYNLCHFWSNFEIASLDIWRSEAYRKYFDHLDRSGGFFYERWGDAPIHSIAVAYFLLRDEIHFFDDVGYFHHPFLNCPFDPETRIKKKCTCDPNKDVTFKGYFCTNRYYKINNLKKPDGWEKHSN